MITLKNVSFTFANTQEPSLKNINLNIGDGECILLCGASGSGKTCVTRLINGLIPHYYEGKLSGQVLVHGQDIATSELYDISTHVGSVFQNPRSQFFCVDSTSELAFGCENQGIPEEEILRRIDETSKQLHLEPLLDRDIFDLSGGEKQKIACGSVSNSRPDIFVLDEPSSNLDFKSIADLKDCIRHWKDEGKTIIITEHRLF